MDEINVSATACAAMLLLTLAARVLAQGPAHITVDSAQRFQFIDGFGVNFNGTYFRERSSVRLWDMPATKANNLYGMAMEWPHPEYRTLRKGIEVV